MSSTGTNSSKISVAELMKFLRQSQLLESADCDQLDEEFLVDVAAGNLESALQVAAELVDRGMLTRWQADKLLQGKHRSFQLGKYRLLGLVGKGGMSTVYLAEHRVMKRRCALKVLPTRRVRDASWLGRFHREAQVGASLDHPNIIRTYDVDYVMDGDAEVHFIVMEYVDGDDLKRIIERSGPFSQSLAADYIRQSADGLAHAHAAGLVHRDIKPANLLLEADGTIRLMDLGLVTAFEDEGNDSLTRAHNERVIGTADYLSPEQALDSHLVDPRSDLYGLGGTLYYLLTGRPPFNEGTLAQRILAHQSKEPDSLSSLVPGMSPQLEAIVKRMMCKKPDDRFQTAQQVSAALTHWLAKHGTSEWKTKHYRLLEQLPDVEMPVVDESAGDDEHEHIPVAEPVIPHFESPYSPPGSVSVEPQSTSPSASSVLSEMATDDYFASSSRSMKRAAGSGDRWLMAVAVSMFVGLALLAGGVAFGWF